MTQDIRLYLICSLAIIVGLGRLSAQTEEPKQTRYEPLYMKHVQKCMDLLMEHGTDTYGKVHAPILVTILDIESRNCPEIPEQLDAYYRVTRPDRRSPGGSNLLTDQPTLKAMYALSEITGNNDYTAFANNYANYIMKNLVDKQGFFWWGWHRHYDVFEDTNKGHNQSTAIWGERVYPHEIHAMNGVAWDRLWILYPDAVMKEIEAIWSWHVIDKESGEINRHGDGKKGCDFTMSGGSYIEAFAFMYAKTKNRQWLDRARLIADYYWKRRNPDTNLLPERPNARERFDGSSFVTSITGLYCYSLLKAYELTNEKSFRDYALTYLKAYAELGFDEQTGMFWGALQMDGRPIPGPRVYTDNIDSEEGYPAAQPRGHLDLWEPYVAGYQYAIYTAQSYAYAYQITDDPIMLTAARRFATWINKTPPGSMESEDTWYKGYSKDAGRKGTYAGKYGRTISFFLHLYILTGERPYLEETRKFADEAIEKLNYKGLFRGHPAKPYYEAMDGVGYLLYALLQLDQVLQDPSKTVSDKKILLGSQKFPMPLDNW
jgi:hypothetical protein